MPYNLISGTVSYSASVGKRHHLRSHGNFAFGTGSTSVGANDVKYPSPTLTVKNHTNVTRYSPCITLYGCFLKWWYPTTMGFPTKNDRFGMFWGYHHLRKHPYASYLWEESCGIPLLNLLIFIPIFWLQVFFWRFYILQNVFQELMAHK